MAGAGYKLFATGDVLTAAQVNTYLQEQVVMVFADAAARTTALSGVLAEGMITYLKSTDAVEVYNGSAWINVASDQTPLTTKGDLFTYSTQDARLAVGSNGEMLIADSSQTTGLRYNAPVGSLANPVINGGMDIWQRGTSSAVTSSSTSFYGPDRWQIYRGATGSTVSRQTTSDTTNLPNIQYSMRLQRDSGNTSTSGITAQQNFETVNALPFSGKTVTLSFYARAGANYSASSSNLTANLVFGTGTDQNLQSAYTGLSYVINQNVTLTTTWQRFALTGTIGATATELAVQFAFTPTGTASTNDWFEVTGVQLDVGTWTASTAPTFRRAGGTIQGELAACQRYYWRLTPQNGGDRIAAGYNKTTTVGRVYIPYFVPMRTSPSSLETSGTAGDYTLEYLNTAQVCSAVPGASNLNRNIAVVEFNVSSGLTAGDGCAGYFQGTNGYLGFSAEL